MAQIIKNRRGPIGNLKAATANNGEVIVASGSISDLSGPFVFIGSPNPSDNGSAGAFKAVSKIYTGADAPTISNVTYGTTLDGTPFYSSNDQALYILNNDGTGNSKIDLTGNIENNVISSVEASGSFSGSFSGDGSNLTNVPAAGLVLTGTGLVSSSAQIDHDQTTNFNSAEHFLQSQITTVGTVTSGDVSAILPSGTVSSSAQLSEAFLDTLGDGVISSSAQVNADSITNFDTNVKDKMNADGVVSSSAQLSNTFLEITGDSVLSSSAQVVSSLLNQATDFGTGRVSGDDFGDIDGTSTFTGSFEGSGAGLTGIVADGTVSGSPQIDLGSASGEITLGTQSTGNYVESLVAGNLIDLQNNTGEGATPTIDVDLTEASEAAITNGDYILFLDGGATGTHAKENIADVATLFAGNGLTATNSVIAVDYGSTSNTAVQGNTTITINGTANEIDITGTSAQSLGGGPSYTIGLPNDVTIGNNLIVENDVFISGSLTMLGDSTSVIVSSSTLEIDDNVIRLNAFAPFQRYAGFEVIDSGSSGVSASLQWDSQNDYWLIESSSKQSGKVIATTYGTFGSETSLTSNTIPKATGPDHIGNSALTDNGTTLAYNTNKFTVASSDGATTIAGNLTLSATGGTDGGSNGSAVAFRNGSNVVGYVSTTETTDVLDGILGYKNANGALVFSTVIDGGTF